MNYSIAFFNKNIYELVYADIVEFFVERKDETINLEFKSYPPEANYANSERKVMEAVCGLLNSEGGIVIWGAPIESADEHGNKSAQGELTPFDTRLNRDRLINKIASLIIPLPIGIKVQQLNNDSGNSIFVIEIAKSIQKPHQYRNNYYIRLDGQTKIAPHYLIEAMMKSVDFPIIRGHLRLKMIEADGHNYILHFRKVIYNTSMINELNLQFKIVGGPGTIVIGGNSYLGIYDNSVEILSYGRPISNDFILRIPVRELTAHNNSVRIVLNFVGKKSPSKTSSYEYLLPVSLTLGDVTDENTFLVNKSENRLASDVGTNNDDDTINYLLNY